MGSNVYSLWLPDELVHIYEQLARSRGVARNRLMREVLELGLGPLGATTDAVGNHATDSAIVEQPA